MSAKEFIEVYPLMTDTEKELMYDLFMKGINHDGHTWVTYGDVERVVGLIIKGRIADNLAFADKSGMEFADNPTLDYGA